MEAPLPPPGGGLNSVDKSKFSSLPPLRPIFQHSKFEIKLLGKFHVETRNSEEFTGKSHPPPPHLPY